MNRVLKSLSVIFALLFVITAFAGCTPTTPKENGEESKPDASTPNGAQSVSSEPATGEDKPYVFPEDGVLKLLADGKAPAAPEGLNPSLADDKVLVFFDFATKKAGLDLADDTEISFRLTRKDKSVYEGTVALDTSVPEIKNEYGYIGVCFDPGVKLDKYETAKFTFSFKDKSGKEYSIKEKSVTKGLAYYGFSTAKFDKYLKDTCKCSVGKDIITMIGNVMGNEFVLTINLSKWSGKTKVDQIVHCARLFWGCYPRMYARFGVSANSPKRVTLAFEDEGYDIASAGGNFVHIHDKWLKDNKTDFDCLTHEFAHVIQNGWDGSYCEYSGYIERFADCCRYIYAYDNGSYNDLGWTLNTVEGESTRESSVRFLVWLDYNYTTKDNDILLKWFTVCRSGKYPSYKWDEAWDEVFKGSDLEGKSIDEVWNMYASSEFSKLSARGLKDPSPLLQKYDIREKTKRLEEERGL